MTPPGALDFSPDPLLVSRLGEDFIKQHRLLPKFMSPIGELHVLVPEGTSSLMFDDVRTITQAVDVIPEYAPATIVENAIADLFDNSDDLSALVAMAKESLAELSSTRDTDDSAFDEGDIARIVTQLFRDAIRRDASDIHIHPYTHAIRVRFREDGVLQTYHEFDRAILPAIVSRLKIMSQLDIAETRKPQDGRLSHTISGRKVDMRISTVPTVNGEKVVMRILKSSDQLLTVDQLGMAESTHKRFMKTISQPYGMFLVTGPTGSGKSFTLFSAMKHLNQPGVNIHTVEDPVEYTVDGLAQTAVNPKAGVTFAGALRTFLRQDPDIIMVGEIRDIETAGISVEAALTGHLMLATLHTNNAAGAVTRLKEMGVESFNIAASLLGVLAQRLLRRVCKNCAVPASPNPAAMQALGITEPENHNYHQGQGCPACENTGYRGRTAIHELLTMNSRLGEAIMRNASTDELTHMGQQDGMLTLQEDAIAKAFQGITTLEEVLRVTTH